MNEVGKGKKKNMWNNVTVDSALGWYRYDDGWKEEWTWNKARGSGMAPKGIATFLPATKRQKGVVIFWRQQWYFGLHNFETSNRYITQVVRTHPHPHPKCENTDMLWIKLGDFQANLPIKVKKIILAIFFLVKCL